MTRRSDIINIFVVEDIDHANWIILDHIIVQAIGKEDAA
jgi:hypothetical protein